jgi:hypothetical protein
MREHPLNRDEAASQLRFYLSEVSRLRNEAQADASHRAARLVLRHWQSERLLLSYPDLLASPRFGQAARFFLEDLYGPKNFSKRDAEVARIVPALSRMLPGAALEVIARALELDLLSETLDARMTRALGDGAIDATLYAAAYRTSSSRAERERQIQLIGEVGRGLHGLVRLPLIGTTLALMRGPAQAAGLAELQDFLQRGYAAFKKMGEPTEFLQTIEKRETLLLGRLFAEESEPFAGSGTGSATGSGTGSGTSPAQSAHPRAD